MTEPRGRDVIVVGAGAAGCVVARRLHDAGASVLVLEAGGSDADPMIADPRRFPELVDGPHDWAYRTEPQAQLGGRRLAWPQGRVLGGSSSLNGMVWIRGCHADYDGWAAVAGRGWSYAEMLPILRRIEDLDRGPSEYRGAGGPMPVWSDWEPDAIHRAVVDGMLELGIPFNEDHNGGAILGTGYCQYNIRGARRVSAADAYLKPVLGPGGVELRSGARVRRLLFEGDRCVGVEWERDGRAERARAGESVVVTCGAIGSPKLLLLSGIGPADELGELGIEVVADLPGVGVGLHDHVHVPLQFSAERVIGPPPAGLPTMQTNTFISTAGDPLLPDVQAPSVGELSRYPGIDLAAENGFTVAVTILRTASRGRLRLASADPADAPLIDPNTYAEPEDLAAMLAGLRLLRTVARTDALEPWGVRELAPGPGVDDEGLDAYARSATFTAAHPAGTCRMGGDELAVVDPELRVRPIAGLRVADSSIMPQVTSGNTHVPSLAIGERAADLLIGARAAADGVTVAG